MKRRRRETQICFFSSFLLSFASPPFFFLRPSSSSSWSPLSPNHFFLLILLSLSLSFLLLLLFLLQKEKSYITSTHVRSLLLLWSFFPSPFSSLTLADSTSGSRRGEGREGGRRKKNLLPEVILNSTKKSSSFPKYRPEPLHYQCRPTFFLCVFPRSVFFSPHASYTTNYYVWSKLSCSSFFFASFSPTSIFFHLSLITNVLYVHRLFYSNFQIFFSPSSFKIGISPSC